MRAPTAGHSFSASQTALVKNDMKPRPTPCFSLNLSLYLARSSIIGAISTSLKVVSMAVSFLTATRRLATVFRNDDIFSRRSVLEPAAAGAVLGASTLGVGGAAFGLSLTPCGFSEVFSAINASSLVILPPTPVPVTACGATPFSAKILAAAGEGVPDA